ncbi:MAG: hypothetical protein EOP88_09220 [Verrucomicrobiaceae bacterium]|nr:MAG: hypothetical protein EOP88_09220 [Verrucomicrobiaceae bacterium]
MPVVSSIFLSLALILAVVVGPQTRAWPWGPSLMALGLSAAAALPVFWRKSRAQEDFGMVAFGTLTVAWFAWRAWISPVAEFGQADLMLLGGATASFIAMRAIGGNPVAERILVWSIALLLLANVAVIGKQVLDPSFTPLFRSRAAGFPSGFYAHYNEAANFLIASSLLVAAAALFGKHRMTTRIIWGLIAVAGLVAVRFTWSRGGIFAAAASAGVFLCAALIVGRREKAKWFGPALIAIPLLGIGLAAYTYMGWRDAQELRQAGSGMAAIMDNNSRLFLLGIALSCIGLHPVSGGGSRSFSWENYRFSENTLQGDSITHIPEQVHNELMQSATDYGLAGAGLLIGLFGAMVIAGVIRIIFSESQREGGSADAWRVGGLAALAGMFLQSCFSFVFHLIPGTILLGICLGMLSRPAAPRGRTVQENGTRILLSAVAVACLLFLIPWGLTTTRVTAALWTSYFSKIPAVSPESRADALTEAIRLWPTSAFYQERAAVHQEAAASENETEAAAAAERAIRDYQEAEKLHPHDPALVVNRANLLSQLRRDEQAEAAYDQAIHLQGGMEPAFRGHYSLAQHLMRKGVRLFSATEPEATLEAMEVAAQQMEESVKEMHWVTREMEVPRVSAHESLGAAREANGDYKGAMEAYEFATKLPQGGTAYYRTGVLFGKMAAGSWNNRRPAEALAYFIEAKKRILPVRPLPEGVTPSQRLEYLTYLDNTITFLQEAKITPQALPPR